MATEEFLKILQKIVEERGKDIFLEPRKLKPLLLDYTKNNFNKECLLLEVIIDAGGIQYINTAEDITDCKQFLVKHLEDEYSLSPSKSAEMLDTLFFVLRDVELPMITVKAPSISLSSETKMALEALKSIDNANAILKLFPNNIEALCLRGLSYMDLRDYGKAIIDLSAVLEIEPNNVNVLRSRGRAYYEVENFDKAIADFSAILEIEPNLESRDRLLALGTRAGIYDEKKGDYDKAITDYNIFIADCNAFLKMHPEDNSFRKIFEICKRKVEILERIRQ